MIGWTTKDVDIVALRCKGKLVSPAPMPGPLVQAAKEVAEDLGLDRNWLNNGPSRGQGGLFQMGLPLGFADRLHSQTYADRLTVHFADRFDQIHFKLYAAADHGGYHIDDLHALSPSPAELDVAARWCMTHDVSEGFKWVPKRLLQELGYGCVADRL